MSSNNYTLNYFNGRGRAELSRLLFAAAGVSYNDNRIADWPATKGDAPLGQLPYLEVNGVKIPQSIAIARYLANEFNLAGRNNLEKAQADAIVDTTIDAYNVYFQKVFFVQDPEAKKQAEEKFSTEDLPKHLANLEKLISLYGKNGYSVGDSLTWSDLQLFSFLEMATGKNPSIRDSYALLNQVVRTVESQPKVSNYLATRPNTPF